MEPTVKTSFQKRGAPKVPSIPGTKPALLNFQLLTSTGIPSLDILLGGGVAVGTVLLVEDHLMTTQDETEIQNDFSNIFTKYFAAEGVVHRHELLFASSAESEDKFFSNLPEINREEEKPENIVAGNDLKIAWRYQNQQQSPQAIAKRGYSFNIQKVLPKEELESLGTHFWSRPRELSSCNYYDDAFVAIKLALNNSKFSTLPVKDGSHETRTVLRIIVHDLGSIFWDPSCSCSELVKFVFRVRAIARQHLSAVILTISSESEKVLREEKGTLDRVRSLCDYVVQLTPFNKEQRLKGLFKDHHGVLKITQIPNLNTLRNPTQENIGSYLFKSLRTKLTIEKIHLPPSIGEEQLKTTPQSLDF